MNREIVEDIVSRSIESEAQRIKLLWKQERMIRDRKSGGSMSLSRSWAGTSTTKGTGVARLRPAPTSHPLRRCVRCGGE